MTARLAAWPSGLGRGLQSPVRRFDSARRLQGSRSSATRTVRIRRAASCEAARQHPTPPPSDEVVELLASIDPATLDADTFDLLLAGAGMAGEPGAAPDVPEATAGINGILDVCPPELAERVLVEFFNRLYVPPGP